MTNVTFKKDALGCAGSTKLPARKMRNLRNISLAATALTIVLGGAAIAQEWAFRLAQEDWGETCYAFVKSGFSELGLMSGLQGPLVAYLQGVDAPSSVKAQFWVAGHAPVQMTGGRSDYSGALVFDDISESLLAAFSQGNRVAISIKGADLAEFPLTGSSTAIQAFRDCLSPGTIH